MRSSVRPRLSTPLIGRLVPSIRLLHGLSSHRPDLVDTAAHLTNPNRPQQLHLLGTLVADRCARHLRGGSDHARVLDLGVGSGSAARSLLDVMPPRSSIVGVDASATRLEQLRTTPHGRLHGLHIAFEALERNRVALGLLKLYSVEQPTGPVCPFASVVADQSLCEVDIFTKRRALGFARGALAPGGALYILERFACDLSSPLVEDHAALWDALHPTPVGGLPWGEYAAHVSGDLVGGTVW